MSTARRILIVDDDEDLRLSLQDQLALHDEFDVTTAGTASKGSNARAPSTTISCCSTSACPTWTGARR